jgi:ferredoxin
MSSMSISDLGTASHVRIDAERCDGCCLCIDVCPSAALRLAANPSRPGKRIAVVDPANCMGCGICQGTCPKEAASIDGFSTAELRQRIGEALSPS